MIRRPRRAFNPVKATIQLITARYVVRPLVAIYSHFQVIGKARIPKAGPLVVAANHISLMDPPLLVVALDRPIGVRPPRDVLE